MASWSGREQLLEELRAGYIRLKSSPSPIKDGQAHLVPFCETLENVLRVGLKQPGSFLRVTKRDYWDWIEVLPTTSLCNAKKNPLLTLAVETVQKSDVLKTAQGRGRCFLRMALVQKLIPIPVEHLLKNLKLLSYWYSKDSIIHQEDLASQLVQILFEVTELDFELNERASFLDETWIIPEYIPVELEPCERLGLKLVHMRDRVLVDGVVKGSIVDKSQIKPGDIVDELNGVRLFGLKLGQTQQIVSKHNGVINLVLVKSTMSDGTPFAPCQLRQVQVEAQKLHKAKLGNKKPSALDQTDNFEGKENDNLRFDVVLLGEAPVCNPIEDGAIDAAIHRVLEGTGKPQAIFLCLERRHLVLSTNGNGGKALNSFRLGDVAACARGVVHRTCFGFAAGNSLAADLTCYVFETPSDTKAKLVVKAMVSAFRRSTWFIPSPRESSPVRDVTDGSSPTSAMAPSQKEGAASENSSKHRRQLSAPGTAVWNVDPPASGRDSPPTPIFHRGSSSRLQSESRSRTISRSSEQLCDPVLRRSWDDSFFGEKSADGVDSSYDVCDDTFAVSREETHYPVDLVAAGNPNGNTVDTQQQGACRHRGEPATAYSDFEVISDPDSPCSAGGEPVVAAHISTDALDVDHSSSDVFVVQSGKEQGDASHWASPDSGSVVNSDGMATSAGDSPIPDSSPFSTSSVECDN